MCQAQRGQVTWPIVGQSAQKSWSGSQPRCLFHSYLHRRYLSIYMSPVISICHLLWAGHSSSIWGYSSEQIAKPGTQRVCILPGEGWLERIINKPEKYVKCWIVIRAMEKKRAGGKELASAEEWAGACTEKVLLSKDRHRGEGTRQEWYPGRGNQEGGRPRGGSSPAHPS